MESYRIIRIVGNILSLTASVLSIILYWFFKEIRSFTIEIQIWLAVSIIIFSIGNILPYKESTTFCSIQAFIFNSGSTSISLWTIIIAYTCLINLISTSYIKERKTIYRLVFLLICFLIPIGITTVVYITESFGKNDSYCWVNLKKSNGKKMLLILFSFDWFIIIANCFFTLKIFILVRKKKGVKSELYSYTKWYPIINIVCELLMNLNYLFLFQLEGTKVLPYLHTISNSFQGLILMLIFLSQSGVSQSLVILLRRCKCKKKDNKGRNTSNEAQIQKY